MGSVAMSASGSVKKSRLRAHALPPVKKGLPAPYGPAAMAAAEALEAIIENDDIDLADVAMQALVTIRGTPLVSGRLRQRRRRPKCPLR